jgi:hypothetical protein
MKTGFIKLLQILIPLAGLAVVGICALTLPVLLREDDSIYRIMLSALYVGALPLLATLYYASKYLRSFTQGSADMKAWKYTLYFGVVAGIIYTAALPFVLQAAQMDDAPGLMLFGLAFAGTPLGLALVCWLLQRPARMVQS